MYLGFLGQKNKSLIRIVYICDAQETCGHLYAQELVIFVYKGGFQSFASFLIVKALLRQD